MSTPSPPQEGGVDILEAGLQGGFAMAKRMLTAGGIAKMKARPARLELRVGLQHVCARNGSDHPQPKHWNPAHQAGRFYPPDIGAMGI
jgi:hypothetical protein